MSNQSHLKKNTTPATPAFDPWLLWLAFRRHWAWIVSAGLALSTAGSLFVYMNFVPEYEATCILQANHDFVLNKDVIGETRDLARNERIIIMSPMVLGNVLNLPELRTVPSLSNSDTRDGEIRKRVKISNGGTDDLLLISYRDSDKTQAAKVANAIADQYIKERKRYDAERFKSIVNSLRIPIQDLERKVKEGRDALKKLSERTLGIDPYKKSGESVVRASNLEELRKRSFDLESEFSLLTDQLEERKAQLGQDRLPKFFLEREIEAFVDQNSTVRGLREKIAFNESAIKTIERKEQQGIFPSRYRDLKKELVSFQEQLTSAEADARSKADGALRDEYSRAQQEQVRKLEGAIANLEFRRERLNADITKETGRLEEFSGETAELCFVRDQVDEDYAALTKARNRKNAMDLEQGRGPSISTRSTAQEPSAPIESTPVKKIVMVGGMAFLVPFLLALLIEFQAKRITSAESVVTNQLIPILGEIAKIPNSRKRSTGHRMFEESIDAMRSNLLFKMEGVRTIAITSAMSGEGKSNIAFQLASSIARCTGENVLVVDADLRNPDQHDLFGLELGSGLCKLLSGVALLDKCIDSNAGELVHLLSAGRLDSNPHNLLTKINFEKVLQQVADRYRYVVVDTAPVLPAAETLIITAACDATLLCAMRDVSQSQHVKRTFHRLQESGANVIGTVFSGVPSRVYASRYGDYRYAKNS